MDLSSEGHRMTFSSAVWMESGSEPWAMDSGLRARLGTPLTCELIALTHFICALLQFNTVVSKTECIHHFCVFI